jgi:hypothetical protein
MPLLLLSQVLKLAASCERMLLLQHRLLGSAMRPAAALQEQPLVAAAAAQETRLCT